MDASRLVSDPAFEKLKHWAIDTTGMAFLADRDDAVAHAVARRIEEGGFSSTSEYLSRLLSAEGGAERDALVDELTIGETYFFRFRQQWDAFTARIVPAIIERNRTVRRLHIWCAGCSSGAEPYTAAILLRDHFSAQLSGWQLRIVGTDINRRFLRQARAARYGAWSLRATPEEARDRHFVQDGRDWLLRPEYRQGVEFLYHNLVSGAFPPDPGLLPDLILCRNVFIYFDRDSIARIVAGFRGLLPEDGWLLVGHAELDARLFKDFEAMTLEDAVLYRKSNERRAITKPLQPGQPRVSRSAPRLVAPRAGAAAPPLLPPAPRLPADDPQAEPQPERFLAVLRDIGAGALQAAATRCHAWLEETPLDAWAHLALATLHRERGQIDCGERALRDALYLDRSLCLAHYDLACLLRNRGDRAGARRGFRTVAGLCAALPAGRPVPGAPDLDGAELRAAALLNLDRLGSE